MHLPRRAGWFRLRPVPLAVAVLVAVGLAVSTKVARSALVEPVIRASAEVVAAPAQVGPLSAILLSSTSGSGIFLTTATSSPLEPTAGSAVMRSVTVASLDASGGSTARAAGTVSAGDRAIIQVRDAPSGRTVLVPSSDVGDGRLSIIVNFD